MIQNFYEEDRAEWYYEMNTSNYFYETFLLWKVSWLAQYKI